MDTVGKITSMLIKAGIQPKDLNPLVNFIINTLREEGKIVPSKSKIHEVYAKQIVDMFKNSPGIDEKLYVQYLLFVFDKLSLMKKDS